MDTTSLPVTWLDASTVQYEPSTTADMTVGGYYTGGNCYPYTTDRWTYYHYWPNWRETVKIRLTMTDVEKLREAAKKDKTLKKVLQKIGPHIEVEVDF